MHQLQKALQLFLPARISPFRTLCVGDGKPTRFIIAGQSFYSGNKKSPFHQDEDSRFHLILHIHCCIYLIGYHGYPCSVTGTPGFIYWTSINLAQKRTSLNFLYPLPPFGLALTFPSGTLFRHCLESVALNVTSRKLNVKKNMLPFHG